MVGPGPGQTLPVVVPAMNPGFAGFFLECDRQRRDTSPQPYTPMGPQWSWTATPRAVRRTHHSDHAADRFRERISDAEQPAGAGHWRVNVKATVIYNPGPNQVVRFGNLIVDAMRGGRGPDPVSTAGRRLL